jgi:hypothetical protein
VLYLFCHFCAPYLLVQQWVKLCRCVCACVRASGLAREGSRKAAAGAIMGGRVSGWVDGVKDTTLTVPLVECTNTDIPHHRSGLLWPRSGSVSNCLH